MLMDIHTFFPTLGSAVLARRVHSPLLDPDCLAPFTTLLLSAAAVVTSPFVFLHRLGFYFYFFLVMAATASRGASLPLTEKEAGASGGGSLVLCFRSLREDADLNPPDAHRQKANNDGASQ